MTKKDHATIAEQYCRDVVEGRIFVCGYVTKACQRHLDDLKRQSTPAFPYRFDPDTGNKVCRFMEQFRIFEGPLTGQNIDLMAWQCFLIVSLFSWLCDGGDRDGKRRFRRTYIEVPRGNSKSVTASLIALWMLACDGEGGAQVVAAGTSRDVAKIVFGAAQEVAKREAEFMKALGVEVLAHTIIQKRTASRFWPLSADSKTSDGLSIHASIIDELHLHKDRRLFDSLETGLGKRAQSLGFYITTAGFDTSGVAYEQRTYLAKILDKTHTDESTFGIIYTVPEGFEDDWLNPDVWKACNPAWGRMVMPEVIAQLADKARVTPAAQNNFRTKHCNIWCSADQAWMDMTKWRAMSDPNLRIEDFHGEPVFIGLDTATRSDITAKVYTFVRDGHYYLFATSYLPEAAISIGKNSQYQGWQIAGLLTVTPGDTIDFSEIEAGLLADQRNYDVRGVGFDPWSSTQLAQRMMAEGLPMIEVRMNVGSLSEPMKQLESLARQRRLHHNNPILDWCISNVTVVIDRNENIFPRKQRAENKIDLAVASIIAMALAAEYQETPITSLFQS